MLDASFERGPSNASLEATPPSTIVPSVLTTRPWPVRQKRMALVVWVSHTRHNSKPIPVETIVHWAVYTYNCRVEWFTHAVNSRWK